MGHGLSLDVNFVVSYRVYEGSRVCFVPPTSSLARRGRRVANNPARLWLDGIGYTGSAALFSSDVTGSDLVSMGGEGR